MAISEPRPIETRFPIEKLLVASAFPHEVSRITVMETHISWIVLTGKYAYKIKKPVLFDFVDYSTLEKRRVNCLREVRLNQRYSEGIYLDVVDIHEQDGRFQVANGEVLNLEPVEYAVKMTEFKQEKILTHQLKAGHLAPAMMDEFAEKLASFHHLEPSIEVDDLDGELAKIQHEVTDNFTLLGRALHETPQSAILTDIQSWTEEAFQRLAPKIRTRVKKGCLKNCHGDLHLNNIILAGNHLVPFDGIEFNEHLQNIDPLNEIAFPFMDLLAHGYPEHGWRLLNSYLEVGDGYGDLVYGDLDLIRFFSVYRAMVRAKVAWIHCQVKSSTSGHPSSWLKGDTPSLEHQREPVHPWDHYLDFAKQMITPRKPKLWITFGFSGSGKSTRASEVACCQGAIRIRSDVKRQQAVIGWQNQEKYSSQSRDEVYRQLLDETTRMLNAKFSVVVDATFLAAHHRNWFRDLADQSRVDFEILTCDAPLGELCSRISQRIDDPSEATLAVLNQQMKGYDPLTRQELELTSQSNTQDP